MFFAIYATLQSEIPEAVTVAGPVTRMRSRVNGTVATQETVGTMQILKHNTSFLTAIPHPGATR